MTLIQYIKDNIDSNFDGELPFEYIHKEVEKDWVFTHFEQLEKKVYFLKKGIVQVLVKSKNERRILDFFFEQSFFSSYSSLLSNRPSDVCIIAVTDCEVDVVNYAELKRAYDTSFLINRLGRIETEKLYFRKVQREKALLTKTAEERYKLLLSTHPEIIEQIPIKEISKYLGIRPESLSRIRKKIFS